MRLRLDRNRPSPPNAKASLCGAFCFLAVMAALQSNSMFRRLIAILSLFVFLIAGASAWGHHFDSATAVQCSELSADEEVSCAEDGIDTAFNGEQQDSMEGLVLGFYPSQLALTAHPLAQYLAPKLPFPYLDALQRPPSRLS